MIKMSPDQAGIHIISRTHNVRTKFSSKRIKTLGSTQQLLNLTSVGTEFIPYDSFSQSLSRIKLKSDQKSFALNINLPLMQIKASKHKLQPYEQRKTKNNDFFITKLRRKQEARSKHLIQRLQQQSKALSVLQLCQKWKQSAIAITNTQSKAQTIQQIRKKMRNRKQYCFSQSKVKTEQSKNSSFFRIK